MSYTPKILAFAGSTRKESFNKKLVKIAADAARAAGAQVTYLDLKDIPMPLYDGDLEIEQGIPENAKKLKTLMIAHDGFLISAPEYNSSITGVLKNTIDWASRPVPNEPSLACFAGKVVTLMSASPGALGGLRGLVTVRSLLSNIKVIVLPDQVAVPKAHEAFDADGKLKDPKQQASIEALGRDLVGSFDEIKGIKEAAMKKYLCLVLVLFVVALTHQAISDEVAQKTDGSFVGDNPPKPINSSFVGDISNSTVNDSFLGENIQQHTDHGFVGSNTIQAENSYFAGDNSDQVEQTDTDAAFAEDHSKKAKDDVFIGEDVQKKTDSSFSGQNYGQ